MKPSNSSWPAISVLPTVLIYFLAASLIHGASVREGKLRGKSEPTAHSRTASPIPTRKTYGQVAREYASLPLRFEANAGQADPSVKFLAHGDGYTLFLTPKEAVFTLNGQEESDRALQEMDAHARRKFEARKFYRMSPRFHRHVKKAATVRVAMEGANPSASALPLEELSGKVNYFIGRNPAEWRTGISTYRRIKYSNVYPGIDLVYYGKQGHLEFDFVLAPNADPNAIRLHFDAAGSLTINEHGGLKVGGPEGSFELLRPNVYQMQHGKQVPIQGQFILRADKTVGIKLAKYDRRLPLVVDPVLTYSTYLGGNGTEYASNIAVDAFGNAYVVGQTTSLNFPTYNGYSSTGNSNGLAFVTALDSTGTIVLYSTYLGGTGGDWGAGVAVDPFGNIYVTGSTLSADFPLVNPVQSSLASPNGNAFVARIDMSQTGTASLAFSTYLGGGSNSSTGLGDVGLAIAADQSGLAYVTGQTASDSSVIPFPTTVGALQSSLGSVNGNAFLSVLDTKYGGGTALIYSTYLGGASQGFGDYGLGIAVDSSGNAYVTGQTTSGSPNPFPTTSGAYQVDLNSPNGNAFVSKIATQQSGPQSLVYSTYLGGSSTIIVGDQGSGIGLDTTGKIYVGGDTTSADFPVTAGAYQTANSPGGKGFVALFDPTKAGSQSLVYSTFLGGTNGGEGEVINGLAVDAGGDAVVAGSTSSSDFPTTADAFQPDLKNSSWDAFLTKINPNGTDLIYSTYFGGSCPDGDVGNGVALDAVGNPHLAGSTCSTDLSVAPANAYQTTLNGSYDVFVARFVWNANPSISASLVPSPNSNGWNNSPVTVLFTCAPGPAPIESCSPPVMVRTEGASQAQSGTVSDSQGNTATTTTTVNIDMTAPTLTITSPSDGTVVNTGSVTVTGTLTDGLSGAGAVNCHGVPATLTGSTFSCNVNLAAGSNLITVLGTDLAGNSAHASISIANTGASGQSNPPTITGVAPGQGGTGNTIALAGSGFGAVQGSSVVMFNGMPAQSLSWNDSSISVAVPAGLTPGIATINVGVSGSVSNGIQFTVTQPLFVTPSQIMLSVGNTQPIDLVDENGVAVTGATWTLTDASMAQVNPPSNGQPTLLQANAVGVTTLVGSYGDRSAIATVTVLPAGNSLPSGAVLWSAPSLGSYRISKIVGATPGVGTAAFFAEDDGAYGGHGAIRAFDANGHQLSIWPSSPSSDAYPILVAADNQGGALYFANQDNPNQFENWCYFGRVDQSGNESWEYQESNCYEDTAVGPDGTIYLLEDDFQNSGNNVLTALDPTNGQIKFTIVLPGFDTNQGGADYTMMPPPGDPNGQQLPYCTPGTTIPAGGTSTNAQATEHGNMSIAADGTVYIPLTGSTWFFDGEPCDSTPDPNNPGYTTVVNYANGAQGSYTDSRSLYLMAVKPDGTYTVQTVDTQNSNGPGWFVASTYEVIYSRPVPDGGGGLYIPVERTLYHTGGTNVSLPFPVAPGDDVAVGSDGTAYVRQWNYPNGSKKNILSAVNSGAISWTYQASQGNLDISSTLDSGGVAVSNDALGLFVLDSGGNATPTGFVGSYVSLTALWQDAWYALNVPGTKGGVAHVVLPQGVDDASPWADVEGSPASAHSQPPIATIYLRSFAPWEWFGPEPLMVPQCLNDCFRGDNRSFSTSTTVTSRVTGVVTVYLPLIAVTSKHVYSSPSIDFWGRKKTGHPKIIASLSNNVLHIEIAGSNPLALLLSPDINTKLDVTIQVSSNQVCYSGSLYGDAFPNSEAFVINSQNQATMLVTFATPHGPNLGPLFYLPGNGNRPMGSFSLICTPK